MVLGILRIVKHFTDCHKLTDSINRGTCQGYLATTEACHITINQQVFNKITVTYCLSGTCCILPILGGWLADAKFGKFSVIRFSLVVFLIGTILLPLGSITNDGKEYSNWAVTDLTINPAFTMTVYVSGLILIAFGVGGFKANVFAFGAEQISYRGPAAIQGNDFR